MVKVKNLDSNKSSAQPPNPLAGGLSFFLSKFFLAQQERSDPPKHQKKTANHCILQKQFFAIFCYFSPRARIMRGKKAQTMTFWWVNYYFLVGNYDILVGFTYVLGLFNYDYT